MILVYSYCDALLLTGGKHLPRELGDYSQGLFCIPAKSSQQWFDLDITVHKVPCQAKQCNRVSLCALNKECTHQL
uniref:Uncharacterized protein n=1 Tax=Anguilla anguilla TaxID=7936 RepID=A0A0E9RIC5_ANGAN